MMIKLKIFRPILYSIGFIFTIIYTGANTYAARSGDQLDPWDYAIMRYDYENEVRDLAAIGDRMEGRGFSDEKIARRLYEKKRALAIEYEAMTPEYFKEDNFYQNERRYGDKYGPSVDDLRADGYSWAEIRKMAAIPEGENIWYNRILYEFGSFLGKFMNIIKYSTFEFNSPRDRR